MRSEHLENLLAIHQTGSINKASKLLYTSPQNVSKLLKQLEYELGFLLVERTPYGVVFTEAGVDMIVFATKIDLDMKTIREKHGQSFSTVSDLKGDVVVYCTSGQHLYFLEPVIEKFIESNPSINVNFINVERPTIYELISENPTQHIGIVPFAEIDGKLGMDKILNKQFDFISIHRDRLIILVPKGSSLSKFKSISVQKLVNERLVLVSGSTIDASAVLMHLAHYLDLAKLTYTQRNPYDMLVCVQKGFGIGLVSKTLFTNNSAINQDCFDMIELQEDTTIHIQMVIKKDITYDLAMSHFIDVIKAYFLIP